MTPPILCFRHSPLCDTWASDVSVGMKVILVAKNDQERIFRTFGM